MSSALTHACDRLSELRRDGAATLFRGRHVRSGRDVLVKTVAHESVADGEWVRRESRILRHLRGPGILECLDASHGEPAFLVLACDRELVPLRDLLDRGRLALDDALEVVAAVATVLVRVHAAGVIHRDLRPEAIGWHEASRTAALIDIGRATEIGPRRTDEPLPAAFAYSSPEQTGRISRSVDQRSDLYSLGVVAYELVAGERPFSSGDAMELVHAHLARTPVAPEERVRGLPRAVSHIILRLLAKNAEDRYQSAAGVLADVERCRAELRETGRCGEFELGAADRPVQLRIPEKLYGRGREMAAIGEALRRTLFGAPEPLFMVGASGIGKSALVHQLRAAVSRAGGLHLEGKFDQLQRDVPYSALRQALRGLVRNLLARTDEEVEGWRARIAAALGQNGHMVADLVPELASLIGPQPPPENLPPGDAELQFHRVMIAFLGVFTSAARPLVLFLDDLQWIDGPTLGLLKALVADP
ncbi:MAG TPA: AAA family ATPase, partial [Kofleriaceae bacterium]|nr:AAA family ATPase [Kofleriaceae bacterium]